MNRRLGIRAASFLIYLSCLTGLCCAGLLWAGLFWAGPARAAETYRIATYNAELFRKGPGLLLRDLTKGKDKQIRAVLNVILDTAPDVLALQGVDWDHDGLALNALAKQLRQEGLDYPYVFAARPNAGVASGFDLNDNGRLGEAADAWGYGTFTGQGGLAVLSRFPIRTDAVQDFSGVLWRDLPGALMPQQPDGTPFPNAGAWAQMPLSSAAHWAVPITLPDGQDMTLLTYRASPPVFDGPEDRNGKRNHDETRFWSLYLDGQFGPAPTARFVLAGGATMDLQGSDGRPEALRALLADPRLQDPQPVGGGAGLATVDWPQVGQLRVDYVLPSADLSVTAAGVHWPAPGQPGHDAALAASRHRLVWVDLKANPAP